MTLAPESPAARAAEAAPAASTSVMTAIVRTARPTPRRSTPRRNMSTSPAQEATAYKRISPWEEATTSLPEEAPDPVLLVNPHHQRQPSRASSQGARRRGHH